MENISEDILVLIFQPYLEGPATMPIPLTAVCRRWYNLVKCTPSLSSRIVINVKTHRTIPFLLASQGFQDYISHADNISQNPKDFPLDIEIRCVRPTTEDHKAVCGLKALDDPFLCSSEPCNYIVVRRKQLKWLLTLLADADTEKQPLTPARKSSHKHRISRWRRLLIESDYDFECLNAVPNNGWLLAELYRAPQLTHLTLKGLSEWYEPHNDFAPNLISLEMEDVSIGRESRMLYWPCLRSLSWRNQSGVILTVEPGTCPVEDLLLAGSCYQLPFIEFPSLRRLTFINIVSYNFLSLLDRQLGNAKQGTSRCLEVIHLINLTADMYSQLAKFTFALNAEQIVLDFTLNLSQSEEAMHQIYLPRMKQFLKACDPNANVIAFNEVTARLIASARSSIEL